VNAQSRTLRVRIVLANPGGTLKPGMFATVNFGAPTSGAMVLVPAEAVIETGKRSVVIVAAGEGRFHAGRRRRPDVNPATWSRSARASPPASPSWFPASS
jgi:multidrug efflux pump subunit AcrA (membrane-fusion protein)